MADDIVPRPFWSFPSIRIPSFLDNDEEWATIPGFSNGLSIAEDDKKVYVEAALPGVNPENVDITFDKGYLWIKGESVEEEKEGKIYYRKASNSFNYRVAVPGEIDQRKEPEATYENGIMMVSFVKVPKTPPKRIKIKAQTAEKQGS